MYSVVCVINNKNQMNTFFQKYIHNLFDKINYEVSNPHRLFGPRNTWPHSERCTGRGTHVEAPPSPILQTSMFAVGRWLAPALHVSMLLDDPSFSAWCFL